MLQLSGRSAIGACFLAVFLIVGAISMVPQPPAARGHDMLAAQAAPRDHTGDDRKKRTATPTPTPTATPTPLPTATPTPTPLPTDAPPRAGLGDAIDTYLNNLVAAKRFHGAVLVVHRGSVLLSRGYGPANIDTGAMNTANTRLRLASVTKQFTAMAVMQLVAEGKLGVDDPLCNYISDCPERWHAITIKHLLTHTHGLPNYTDFPSYEQTQMNPTTPEQLLEKLRGQWPVTEPGSTYAYGNSST